MDPRPVLCRAGGRRRPGRTRCSMPRSASSPTACSSTATELAPAYTADGEPVPDERRLDLPGYPGGYDIVGNWVSEAVPARRVRRGAAAVRRRRRGLTGSTRRAGARPRSRPPRSPTRGASPTPASGSSTPTVDAQPADRRRRPARDRPRAPPGEQSAEWLALADRDRRRHRGACAAPERAVAAGARRSARRRRAADPGLRGALPPDDPRSRGHLARRTCRAHRRRLRLPVPARAPAARRRRGLVPAVRVPDGARPASARRRGRGARLVRAHRAACGPPQLYSEEYDAASIRCAATCPRPSCTPCISKQPRAWPSPPVEAARRSATAARTTLLRG